MSKENTTPEEKNPMEEMSEQDKKDILSMDEPTSYFLVDECGMFLFRMNHDLADGRIPEEAKDRVLKDMMNIRVIQKFTVDNLDRFGVDPESAHDKENGDYWKWYKFWDEWKKALSEDDWKIVASGNYKPYLPKTTWKDEPSPEKE